MDRGRQYGIKEYILKHSHDAIVEDGDLITGENNKKPCPSISTPSPPLTPSPRPRQRSGLESDYRMMFNATLPAVNRA